MVPEPTSPLASPRAAQEELPIRILIVDDEPKNLTVLESLLVDPAYQLVKALTADEALSALVNQEFALLILDVQMPGMTGFELAQMIKTVKRTASVPIIFLTAYDSEQEHVLEGYGSGAVDYLHKPVNPPILASKVAVFAELYRKTRKSELISRALLAEVSQRRRIEEELREANEELERRVAERTAKLLRANSALKESEWFTRSILESSGDCIKVLDLEGRLVTMNSPGLRIMELEDFESIRGRDWAAFWPAQERFVVHAALEAARQGQESRFQSSRPTFKGTQKWWDVLVSPIRNEEGQTVQIVSVSRDITGLRTATEALQSSEERLELALLGAELGTWDWQARTGSFCFDQRATEMFGFTPAEVENNYAFWEARIHPEDLAEVRRTLGDHMAGNAPSFSAEQRVRHRNGEWIWVLCCGRVVERAPDGSAVRACGTHQDISERKRAEENLQLLNKRKDEFLAMLGHELRNPLGAIRHAVSVEHESHPDPRTRLWAKEVIDRQSLQLSRIVEDLLDVARIERGRIELRLEALDLRAVLHRAASTLKSLILKRNHQLTVNPGLEALWVKGDPVRLEQVFVNLLTNAAKYTPEGGQLTLEARSEERQALVSVRDTGVGLSAEILPHVFDLFAQAQTSLDRSQGGLGIGLTVVKSLIESHDGSIVAHSAGLGSGSTFSVRLPLHCRPASPVELPADGLPKSPTARPSSLGLRVLIVDDNRDAADGLARLLSRRGCEVRVAYDGPGGLSQAREFSPHTVLLDLGLPELDGYQVCQILRAQAQFAQTQFIAISGYAQKSDIERSHAAGFDEHFAKPVDISALLTSLTSRRASETE